MGMMDNLKPPVNGGYNEGMRDLIIENIETKLTSGGKEYKYLTFLFENDTDKHITKKIWDDDFAGRKLAEIVIAVGLNSDDLFTACGQGRGDDWMHSNLPGRRGRFDCRKGRPNQDGKQYLEPMTRSEIEYMEWRKAHPKNGQSDGNVQSSHDTERERREASGEFDSDIPF